MNPSEITLSLIRIKSVSGEEREVGKFLVNLLKSKFEVKTQTVGNSFNVIAMRGKPRMLLTTHMDTVPGDIEASEDSEYVYGRGACDAKGIIASMICAAEEALDEGIEDFALLFDVSEETDFSGVKEAIKELRPEFVVIGEPTNLKTGVGQKGLLGIRLSCYGKSAHGSMPEKGESAIEKLFETLSEIVDEARKAGVTLNVGKISGGTAINVVADYAEALIEIRYLEKSSKLYDLIKASGQIEVLYDYDPVGAINDTFNIEDGIIMPYFTEMYFWSKGAKCIVLGPGDFELAHTDNEKVSKKDLEKARQIYLDMIRQVLGR